MSKVPLWCKRAVCPAIMTQDFQGQTYFSGNSMSVEGTRFEEECKIVSDIAKIFLLSNTQKKTFLKPGPKQQHSTIPGKPGTAPFQHPYLAQPHVHQGVPGLANLPHIQFTCPRCHQAWRHSSWVRSIQAAWIRGIQSTKLLKTRAREIHS